MWVCDLSMGQGQASFDLSQSQWDRFGTSRTCPTGTSTACPNLLVPLGQVVLVPVASPSGTGLVQAPLISCQKLKNQGGPNRIREIPYQKSVSNWSKIETKNRFFSTKLTQNVLPKGRRDQANKDRRQKVSPVRVQRLSQL